MFRVFAVKADFLMREQKHEEALKILETVVHHFVQSDGKEMILALIKKTHCLLLLEDTEEAIEICKKVIAGLEKEEFKNEKQVEKLYQPINELLERIIDNKKESLALSLHCSLIYMTRFIRQGTKKLQKLKDLAWLMRKIIKEPIKEKLQSKFERNMDDILHELQIATGINVREKTENIAWFLKHYGDCYINAKRNLKANELYKQAVLLIKSVLGNEANSYQVLGFCYHNLGVSYNNSKQQTEAKIMYKKALAVYEHVIDWKNEKEKASKLALAKRNLKIIANTGKDKAQIV